MGADAQPLVVQLMGSTSVYAPSSEAAQEPGAPAEPLQFEGGAPRIDVGPCWGEIQNPHNSREHPGRGHMQAKTLMRCNERLSQIGELAVTNSLYYRADSYHSWSFLAVNTSDCNAATFFNAANGWVQCRTVNQGVHPVMIAGVNAPCVTGTRYDYLQTSSALLATNAGGRYAGAGSKTADNVLCRGR